MKHERRASDKSPTIDVNILQTVNAPVSIFHYYRDLAMAKFGDSTKRQYFFRQALTEYMENHKEEHDKILSNWRKNK